jgi:DNA-binding NarL/FixJ family response regulator
LREAELLTGLSELMPPVLGEQPARSRLDLLGRDGGHVEFMFQGFPVLRGPGTLTNPAGLTDRQLEILRLVATGLSNAEIAHRLVVSPRTVDHHVSAILQKLSVPTRRDAAAQAAELWSKPYRTE